jgi:putative RNA 2'-phosphotransferase
MKGFNYFEEFCVVFVLQMKRDLKVKVSRYMSYLLRHNPENLKMDKKGFVSLDEITKKIRERFNVDKAFILEIAKKSDRKRFEVVGNKIRALYGHTIDVQLEFEEDKTIKTLFHGTTPSAASQILKVGLKPMKRKWVHLSPTIEIATEVALRRTKTPVVLEINAEAARKNGVKFYKASDRVYLSSGLAPKYIRHVKTD